jgi:hypothetical protein
MAKTTEQSCHQSAGQREETANGSQGISFRSHDPASQSSPVGMIRNL